MMSCVEIYNGRKSEALPRTSNTCTGFVVWLTRSEAKELKLKGYSNPKYRFSVDLNGQVERWYRGYGGWIETLDPPKAIQPLS